jgi:methyl-accepting chemotaxis protein
VAERDDLKGADRWILRPATWTGVAGAVLAVVYGWVAIRLPPGTAPAFFGLAAAVLGVGTVVAVRLQSAGLASLRQIAAASAPSRELLKTALRDTYRAPDRTFLVASGAWVLGAVCLACLFAWVPGATLGVCLRIALIGVFVGMAMGVLAHLVQLRRCRQVISRLIALSASTQDVIDAIPPRRRQMRTRLVAFMVITVLVPSLLVVELALDQSGVALEQLVQSQDPAEAARIVSAAESHQLGSTALLAGLVLALVLVAARSGGAALEEPMRAMSEQARRIGEGDLSSVKLVPAEDELWAASAAIAGMHTHLVGALGQLQKAGFKISTTTEQIVQMSSSHQTGATEQATSLNETMATTEELARSARQISTNAAAVARMAEEMLAAARTGQRNAQTFSQSMEGMKRDNQGIADSVVRLNKRVQQIGKIVEFINGIADKSDLLALNAELEGTKAGDVGRGFSLVAAEMRRVAENVIQSTRQIAGLIEEIRDATNAAVMATEAGVKATDAGAGHSQELSRRLSAILDLANATADAIRAISLATQQQQAGTDQLAIAMGNVLQITQQGAQSTRQLGAANADLVALARDLKVVVERFRVT